MKKQPSKAITPHHLPDDNARSRVRILMAEDDLVNQKVVALQIRKLKFRVDVVANGQEAINALQQNPYDVVLMDCEMPEMDGFEATREIRKREALSGNGEFPNEEKLAGKKQHIPIIAMTANAIEENGEQCLECGMDDFLSKPLNQVELKKVLEKWIQGSQDVARQPVNLEGQMNEGEQPSLGSLRTDSPSNLAVLTALRELAGGESPEVFFSLIHEYLEEGHECLTQMARAFTQKDPGALKEAAHKFKGSSQIIGAERLAEICKALEDMGCNNDFEGANSLLDHFYAEYQLVKEYLKTEMETLQSLSHTE